MAPTSEAPASTPFIISTSLARPDPETRRFIRSHVMRGKNEGKFRNRRTELRSQRMASPSKDKTFSTEATGQQSALVHRAKQQRQVGWRLVPPRKVGSELSLYGFGGEMQPHVQELIFRAFTVVKPAMYAWPGMSPASQQDNLFCFDNLARHPGVLYSTLFVAQAFHDSALGHSGGTVAQLHLSKALSHLQRSLNDPREAVHLSTIAAVTSLAMASVIAGELDTAAKHMDGLRRIVELRGGLHSLEGGIMVQHKAQSIDIGLSMALNRPLCFLRDEHLSWSTQLPSAWNRPPDFPELDAVFRSHPPRPDPRLLNVWADLREFSRLMNETENDGSSKPAPSDFARLAISVPHRLLRLQPSSGSDQSHPSVHELLRLGMLAYAKMLVVRMSGLGRTMAALAVGLRAVLTSWYSCLEPLLSCGDHNDTLRGKDEAVKLLLWTAFVASASIFEELDQEWLREMLVWTATVLGLRTWPETRVVLKGFPWIDDVFDQPGQRTFQLYSTP